MKLRAGITSIFEYQECGPLPEYSIADFKRLVYAVAAKLDWEVVSVNQSGVTPNFHAAELKSPEYCVFILGHSNFPIVAFTNWLDNADHCLQFVDNSPLASEISRLYPDIEIGNATELNRVISENDFAQLASEDRVQIDYWKPKTIGQLAFNWWD